MNKTLAIIAIVAATTQTVQVKAAKGGGGAGIPLTASSWTITANTCMPLHPSPLSGMAGWFIDLPLKEFCYWGWYQDAQGVWHDDYPYPKSVNHVTAPYVANLTGKTAVTFTAQVIVTSGDPTFDFHTAPDNVCETNPATASIKLTKKGDRGSEDFGRWFSFPRGLQLDEGAFTVTISLQPENWGSVFGHNAAENSTTMAGFATAIANLGEIGIVFGGGCFAGHGVNTIGGTARFVLTSIAVQ